MSLDDRLNRQAGWVYMTGMQALVRLPIEQRRRDIAAGLNTGGYISGYRGSPLGSFDMNLERAKPELAAHNIHFQPGVNEDLAATATWGAQQVGLFPGARVDGVFSIWYGKAPGMDRSMDPIRHANLAGTSPKGGTLLLVGDDHGAKSSTLACYSDYNFVSLGAPLLAPSNVQEVLDYGLHGIAMSRYAGTLVGLKLVTEVIEGGGSVLVSPDAPQIVVPEADASHPGIRPFTPFMEQERLLWDVRLPRTLAYSRANCLNQIFGAPDARVGIIAAGKVWQDLGQALDGLHYRDGKLGRVGVRLMKVGMVWPLDEAVIREFAKGLETLIIIEEKRPLLEDQIRAFLYGDAAAPRLVGKTWGNHAFAAAPGECAFPKIGEIAPGLVARIVVRAVIETDPDCGLAIPNQPALPLDLGARSAPRSPSFCAGCPHGRSTKVIDGSRALAGIGCHGMAILVDPMRTNSLSQMGGEGAIWLGQFPFTDEPHIFANMGDGTYFHSGLLAIRAAVAAGANMTYKLLHNGFVSMTGGQQHDGEINPEKMVAQLRAEGVARIALVSDEPEKFFGIANADGVSVHERGEMETVQQELRALKGVTAIIYDQPCATERRRLRKRGKWADPDKRVFINPEVCEGCGDCSTISSCMAIEPLETEFGRKRAINQSACNKDFSCVEGFCPSFVTISGAKSRSPERRKIDIDVSTLPEPPRRPLDGSWSILVAGIGGAGVITIGQILAVAAHADGYFSSNLDITGLAQKYGAVHSHIKIAADPERRRATRIALGEANALIGCDLVVAAGDESLAALTPGQSLAVTDSNVVPTADFSKNPDWRLSGAEQVERLSRVLGSGVQAIDAQGLAEKIMGDRLFANMVLVGAAWQQGGIPLSLDAIYRAIELNGAAVARNRQAFDLGRLALVDPAAAWGLAAGAPPIDLASRRAPSIDEIVNRRVVELTAYKDADFARRYSERMRRVRDAIPDAAAVGAVARGLYKLMASKDEWEVARLYSKPAFEKALRDTFDGNLELTFHFGAWPFARENPKTGKAEKGPLNGRVAMPLFKIMNRLRFLRGTLLDPFRNSAEAILARKLLSDYEADVDFAIANWSGSRAAELTELLDLPEHIRGYGHVRERHAMAAEKRRAVLKAAITVGQKAAA